MRIYRYDKTRDFGSEHLVIIFIKKRKKHPSAEATPGRIGGGDQGEARRANSTLNGGPHLELGC